MLVEDILAQKGHQIFSVRPDCKVREMATIIATHNIGTTIVTDDDGTMLGIISERDLVRALSEFQRGHLELRVGELMTRSIITCAPDTTVADALSLMGSHRIRHLPVVQDGDVVGLISIRDLLECRLEGLEENFAALIKAKRETSRSQKLAERVNRAKSEFLQQLTYQLGTPLDTVLDIAEYLIGEAETLSAPPQFSQYLREIEQHGRQLRTLVQDLLELSMLQAKAQDPAPEIVSVADAAAACLRDLVEPAAQRDVTVQLDPSVQAAWLRVDRKMLGRMLHGLVDNAVKFTPAGGTVRVACARDAEGALRISVTDTGIGIPTEHLAKVTTPFYQVDTSLARSRMGSGLGLAIVEAMLMAHGGMLALDSRIRIGTTATLCFPDAAAVEAPEIAGAIRNAA